MTKGFYFSRFFVIFPGEKSGSLRILFPKK